MILTQDRFFNLVNCVDLLAFAEARSHENSSDGFKLGVVGIRFSRVLANKCLIARAYGICATSLIREGRPQKAQPYLDRAFQEAPEDCAYCKAEIYGRSANLNYWLGDRSRALTDADAGVRYGCASGDPSTRGKALARRAVQRYAQRNLEGAVSDAELALEIIDAKAWPLQFNANRFNLSAYLADQDSPISFFRALGKLQVAKRKFSSSKRCGGIRATVRWQEALLWYSLNVIRKTKRALEDSIAGFRESRQPNNCYMAALDLVVVLGDETEDPMTAFAPAREALEYFQDGCEVVAALEDQTRLEWSEFRELCIEARSTLGNGGAPSPKLLGKYEVRALGSARELGF